MYLCLIGSKFDHIAVIEWDTNSHELVEVSRNIPIITFPDYSFRQSFAKCPDQDGFVNFHILQYSNSFAVCCRHTTCNLCKDHGRFYRSRIKNQYDLQNSELDEKWV